jgi:hypothetical protein
MTKKTKIYPEFPDIGIDIDSEPKITYPVIRKKREKKEKVKYVPEKIIFLDIDGVVNCSTTTFRRRKSNSLIGIDPYMALLVGRILINTGAEIVLSSSWRHFQDGIDEVEDAVHPIYDTTDKKGSAGHRGKEIKEWITKNDYRGSYAILDDSSDMLEEQRGNFFRTTWKDGITSDIADDVIRFLNSGERKSELPSIR